LKYRRALRGEAETLEEEGDGGARDEERSCFVVEWCGRWRLRRRKRHERQTDSRGRRASILYFPRSACR
jgi:hypothetical protein